MSNILIAASIVTYNNNEKVLLEAVNSFLNTTLPVKLYIVDNSPTDRLAPLFTDNRIEYIFNNKNLGFGKAHNIAMRRAMQAGIPYYLVLNPDVYFGPGVLEGLCKHMQANPEVGQLMPKVLYPNGETQYLCKLLPTPADFFVRRFIKDEAKLEKLNGKFELRFTGYDHTMNVPYLSGCFMFLRVKALKEVGLFDERIFMYSEDTDLTRRVHQKYKTQFFPDVQIYHHFAKGSHKNLKLLFFALHGAFIYFTKWGWFFDRERDRINNQMLAQYGQKPGKSNGLKLLLTMLLAFFLPWSMTVTSGATIVLAVLALTEGGFKRKLSQIRKQRALLLLLLFFGVYALSTLISDDKGAALFGLEKKLSLLLLPLVFVGNAFSAHNRQRILLAFVLSVVMVSVYCLAYAIYRNYTIGDPATLPYSFAQNFGVRNTGSIYWDYFSYSELARPARLHPTYLSMFTIFSLFILMERLVTGTYTRIHTILQWLAAAFLLIFTLLLSSRIALLGMFISAGFFAYLYYRTHGVNRKQMVVAIGLCAGVFLLLLALPVTRYRILNETSKLLTQKDTAESETGVSQRTVTWEHALQLSKEHWLTGLGVGDVQHALDNSYERHGYPELKGFNSHNQYLQTWLATGIAGLIILLLLCLNALYTGVRHRDRLAVTLVVLLIVTSLTEAILEANKGIVFIGLFYCLLLTVPSQSTAVEKG
ncbi:O-antigen ligase family protein [Pontibacter amylolyticus]|uniref:Glycosyltransferase n=1 Tax=Pontibacter amylolyticus TaxID=1424080 RepID=A0ABQ1WD55_9BACT|nr:O-antigen ligase family protein [Pontibacter amylolyticus]GGG27083.1 hypothetical protein GCM10011323_33250 [Pontibacter amylolyticus]